MAKTCRSTRWRDKGIRLWRRHRSQPQASRRPGDELAEFDGLAEKLKSADKVSDIANATAAAAASTQAWLVVLARTFQQQEGLDVLWLDRVLDASPDAVDDHRRGSRKRDANGVRTSVRLPIGADVDHRRGRRREPRRPCFIRPPHRRRRGPASGSAAESSTSTACWLESNGRALGLRRWSSVDAEAGDRAIETGAEGRRGGPPGRRHCAGACREGAGGARTSVQALPARLPWTAKHPMAVDDA